MNRTRAILFTFVISGMLLTACGGKESAAGHQHGADSERYETTASLTVMPEFLSNYTDNTQATYAAVGERGHYQGNQMLLRLHGRGDRLS